MRQATLVVVALHLILLLAAVPDYMVSVDSAFHTALARQYGEHGTYFWDAIHYGPAHRPNLQGPALHMAIGFLGRLLGGTGDAYVLANALLGVACWLAAVCTAVFFARRFGSDRAGLFAAAMLGGAGFAAGSFRVNIPSGWVFVLTPWAIHFFLERRLALAIACTALACYTHLGGFVTAPFGLLVAALLARRLRDLVITGVAVVLITTPYWLHFLRSLSWYVGRKGDTAWLVDPLVGVLGLI